MKIFFFFFFTIAREVYVVSFLKNLYKDLIILSILINICNIIAIVYEKYRGKIILKIYHNRKNDSEQKWNIIDTNFGWHIKPFFPPSCHELIESLLILRSIEIMSLLISFSPSSFHHPVRGLLRHVICPVSMAKL